MTLIPELYKHMYIYIYVYIVNIVYDLIYLYYVYNLYKVLLFPLVDRSWSLKKDGGFQGEPAVCVQGLRWKKKKKPGTTESPNIPQ